MSETAVAAPPVPGAEAPVTPTVPASVPEQQAPLTTPSIRDRIANVERAAKGLTSAQRPQSATKPNRAGEPQPITPDGKYAPTSTQVAASTEPVTAGSEAAVPTPAAPEVTAPTTAPTGPAEGFVRVPLPDAHPLRHKGVKHIDFPKDQEQYGRWSVNQGLRVREFENTRTQLEQSSQRIAELEAQVAFHRDGKASLSPEQQGIYNDLKQAYGPERAEAYKRGELIQAEAQMRQQAEQARTRVVATRFADGAIRVAKQQFPGWTEGEIRDALAAYGSFVDVKSLGKNGLDLKKWVEFARPMAYQSPAFRASAQAGIQARQRQKQDAARIAQEATARAEQDAKAREAERLRQAATSRAQNPLGGLHAQTGRSTSEGGSLLEKHGSIQNMLNNIGRAAKGLKR